MACRVPAFPARKEDGPLASPANRLPAVAISVAAVYDRRTDQRPIFRMGQGLKPVWRIGIGVGANENNA